MFVSIFVSLFKVPVTVQCWEGSEDIPNAHQSKSGKVDYGLIGEKRIKQTKQEGENRIKTVSKARNLRRQ